jgi:DNA-binding response OmpR family regulator
MTRVILSINANKAMSYILESIMDEKFDVIAVDDVYSASEKLKRRKDIRTIIIDIDHSTNEVWDFIHHIKTSKFYNRPIIVLTSDKSNQTNLQAKEAKIRYLLYKPFAPAEIMNQINEIECKTN